VFDGPLASYQLFLETFRDFDAFLFLEASRDFLFLEAYGALGDFLFLEASSFLSTYFSLFVMRSVISMVVVPWMPHVNIFSLFSWVQSCVGELLLLTISVLISCILWR